MKIISVLLAGLIATGAQAQAFVSGPRGCDFIEGFDALGPIYTVDEEHLVLTAQSLEGIEWFCAFEPAFDPYLETGEIAVRAGYCMEPGPFIDPAVFTLLERGDGTVQLDASTWTEPLILEICLAP